MSPPLARDKPAPSLGKPAPSPARDKDKPTASLPKDKSAPSLARDTTDPSLPKDKSASTASAFSAALPSAAKAQNKDVLDMYCVNPYKMRTQTEGKVIEENAADVLQSESENRAASSESSHDIVWEFPSLNLTSLDMLQDRAHASNDVSTEWAPQEDFMFDLDEIMRDLNWSETFGPVDTNQNEIKPPIEAGNMNAAATNFLSTTDYAVVTPSTSTGIAVSSVEKKNKIRRPINKPRNSQPKIDRTVATVEIKKELRRSVIFKSRNAQPSNVGTDFSWRIDKQFHNHFTVNKKSTNANLSSLGAPSTSSSDQKLIGTTPIVEDPYQMGEADMKEPPILKLVYQRSRTNKPATTSSIAKHVSDADSKIINTVKSATDAKLDIPAYTNKNLSDDTSETEKIPENAFDIPDCINKNMIDNFSKAEQIPEPAVESENVSDPETWPEDEDMDPCNGKVFIQNLLNFASHIEDDDYLNQLSLERNPSQPDGANRIWNSFSVNHFRF